MIFGMSGWICLAWEWMAWYTCLGVRARARVNRFSCGVCIDDDSLSLEFPTAAAETGKSATALASEPRLYFGCRIAMASPFCLRFLKHALEFTGRVDLAS